MLAYIPYIRILWGIEDVCHLVNLVTIWKYMLQYVTICKILSAGIARYSYWFWLIEIGSYAKWSWPRRWRVLGVGFLWLGSWSRTAHCAILAVDFSWRTSWPFCTQMDAAVWCHFLILSDAFGKWQCVAPIFPVAVRSFWCGWRWPSGSTGFGSINGHRLSSCRWICGGRSFEWLKQYFAVAKWSREAMSQLLLSIIFQCISIDFNIFHTFSIITSNFIIGRHLPFHVSSFHGKDAFLQLPEAMELPGTQAKANKMSRWLVFFFKPTSIGDLSWWRHEWLVMISLISWYCLPTICQRFLQFSGGFLMV